MSCGDHPYPPCYSICCHPGISSVYRSSFSNECFCTISSKKSSWPELAGQNAEKAKATIKRENPLVTTAILLPGQRPIEDYCCNRVFVWADDNGNVNRVPVIG
ncbi:hypothetical protein BT93_D2119 [Corymbia citriodora subsp. variegata]|nr:hypothetical protein BT93_D2119 [Corymbia citriodora subsp. variegata]